LYAGGTFDKAGGKPMGGVAGWDGTKWNSSKIDSLYDYAPEDMQVFNGELWAAGFFDKKWVPGNNPVYVLKWDGINWAEGEDTVTSGSFESLAIYNNEIYVGGNFYYIDTVNVYNIARSDGNKWKDVGFGVYNNGNEVITMEVFKGELYVGGLFYYAGGIVSPYIARWNGTQWDSVGNNYTNYIVQGMTVDTINNFLYASGWFTTAGGIPANNIARWDGYAWSSLGSNAYFDCNILELEMYHGYLYASGCFNTINGVQYSNLVRWNGVQWDSIPGVSNSDTLQANDMLEWKDSLVIAGNFKNAGNLQNVNSIVKYYEPWANNCNFLQPVIESMQSLSKPNGVSDTFYYTDSVAVQFYNNIVSASSWQWNFGDGKNGSGQTPIHYYNAAGTYSVSVIVNYPYGPNGPCVDTTFKTVTIIYGFAGENNLSSSNLKFKVYPNPTKAEINIEVEGKENKNYIVRITNPLGQKVAEKKFNKRIEVDVSAFSKGLFLVEVCIEMEDVRGQRAEGKGQKCHTEKVVIE